MDICLNSKHVMHVYNMILYLLIPREDRKYVILLTESLKNLICHTFVQCLSAIHCQRTWENLRGENFPRQIPLDMLASNPFLVPFKNGPKFC